MTSQTTPNNQLLPEANRASASINEEWQGTNEQWWNWYLSLADNDETAPLPAPLSPAPAEDPALLEVEELTVSELQAELSEPYPLTDEHVRRFQTDSYLRLPGFLSPGATLALKREALRVFRSHHAPDPKRQFSSMELMWLESELIKMLVTGRRLAQLAATLLGVPRVRLFHDDFLCKEPGGGRTPWHFDGHHYPISTRNIGTAWIPLQPTSAHNGMLELAQGMETHKIIQGIPFDKFARGHDRAVAAKMAAQAVEINTEPFELGELSFQHCLNVHGASANHSRAPRVAYGASYFEDGACVLDSPTMISGDWQKFMPGVQPGGALRSPFNPLVYNSGA